MGYSSINIEAKNFRFLRVGFSDGLQIEERRKGRCRSIVLGLFSLKWLHGVFRDLQKDERGKMKYSSISEGRKAFVAQERSNVHGNFLEIVESGMGMVRGLVVVPRGKNGDGWFSFQSKIAEIMNHSHDRKAGFLSTTGDYRSYVEAVTKGGDYTGDELFGVGEHGQPLRSPQFRPAKSPEKTLEEALLMLKRNRAELAQISNLIASCLPRGDNMPDQRPMYHLGHGWIKKPTHPQGRAQFSKSLFNSQAQYLKHNPATTHNSIKTVSRPTAQKTQNQIRNPILSAQNVQHSKLAQTNPKLDVVPKPKTIQPSNIKPVSKPVHQDNPNPPKPVYNPALYKPIALTPYPLPSAAHIPITNNFSPLLTINPNIKQKFQNPSTDPSSSFSYCHVNLSTPVLPNLREETETEVSEETILESENGKKKAVGVEKGLEKKVGYGARKNQRGRNEEIENLFSIFSSRGDNEETRVSFQKEDDNIAVQEAINVRGNEIVEWKEKGEETLNLMRTGGQSGKIWSITDENEKDFREQVIGTFEGKATENWLIEEGAVMENGEEICLIEKEISARGGNGKGIQIQEGGENQSMVLYEEPIPLSRVVPSKDTEYSSDWVTKMTTEVSRMVGVDFEGFESEWEALLTAIETDRKAKTLKSKGKGSRELRNLSTSIKYKGNDTRGIKLRGKARMLDRQ